MITAPCKNCTNRKLHCHSECEEYKNFRDFVDRTKANRRRHTIGNTLHTSLICEQKEKARRHHR